MAANDSAADDSAAPRSIVGPVLRCEHYACRCYRAAQLPEMCDRTGQGRYLLMAIHAHFEFVECRLRQPPVVFTAGGSNERRI